MREKIASIISLNENFDSGFLADEIIKYQSEEIEKVENPYSNESNNLERLGHDCWEVCRCKILALLR